MHKFNLSLDDMSPHPKAGLNFESIKWCDKLITKYPELKINLFVPASYARLEEDLVILPCNLADEPEWVAKVNPLPDNYRINLHGWRHRRSVRDFYPHKKRSPSTNDEWQFLNFDDAMAIGELMIEQFKEAGLDYVPTFRPPGWKISMEAVKALECLGVTCIAGSPEYYKKLKGYLDTIKWVSYNWDLTKPCDVKGDVVAYGHTSSWTNNYMDEKRYKLIDQLLSSKKFDFRFIEEM